MDSIEIFWQLVEKQPELQIQLQFSHAAPFSFYMFSYLGSSDFKLLRERNRTKLQL